MSDKTENNIIEEQYLGHLLFNYEWEELQREQMEGIQIIHFENKNNRLIYELCLKASGEKIPITPDYITRNGIKLKQDLFEVSGVSIQYEREKEIIKSVKDELLNAFSKREYIKRCRSFVSSNMEQEEVFHFIEDIKAIQTLKSNTKVKEGEKVFQEVEALFYKPKERALKFGIACLDSDVKIEPGNIYYLGGYTGTGKSALALQFIRAFLKQGAKALYVNLEMNNKQIIERLISGAKHIKLSRLIHAESFENTAEEEKFRSYKKELKNLLICSGAFNISNLSLEIKRNPPDIVIIDYLQLITPGEKYKGYRVAEVSEISHRIKALAMELNIPIIALSQLNRESQKKDEPTTSDLRECGDLENDASVVLLLWTDSENPDIKHLKVSKNREGRLNKYELYFEGDYMTFKEKFVTPTEEEQATLPFKAD